MAFSIPFRNSVFEDVKAEAHPETGRRFMYMIDPDYVHHIQKASQDPLVETCMAMHAGWYMSRTQTFTLGLAGKETDLLWPKQMFEEYSIEPAMDLMKHGFTVVSYVHVNSVPYDTIGHIGEYSYSEIFGTEPDERMARIYNEIVPPKVAKHANKLIQNICSVPMVVPKRIDPSSVIVFYEVDHIGNLVDTFVLPTSMPNVLKMSKSDIRKNALPATRAFFSSKAISSNGLNSLGTAGSAHISNGGSFFTSSGLVRKKTDMIDGIQVTYSEVAECLRPLKNLGEITAKLAELLDVASHVPYAVVNEAHGPKEMSHVDFLDQNIHWNVVSSLRKANIDSKLEDYLKYEPRFKKMFMENVVNNTVAQISSKAGRDQRLQQSTTALHDHRDYWATLRSTSAQDQQLKNFFVRTMPFRNIMPHWMPTGQPFFMPCKDLNNNHMELYRKALESITDVFCLPLSGLRGEHQASSSAEQIYSVLKQRGSEKNEYLTKNMIRLSKIICLDIIRSSVSALFESTMSAALDEDSDKVVKCFRDFERENRYDFTMYDLGMKRKNVVFIDEEDDYGETDDDYMTSSELSDWISTLYRGVFRLKVKSKTPTETTLVDLLEVYKTNILPPGTIREKVAITLDMIDDLGEIEKTPAKEYIVPKPPDAPKPPAKKKKKTS